jgi:hypothetical protein
MRERSSQRSDRRDEFDGFWSWRIFRRSFSFRAFLLIYCLNIGVSILAFINGRSLGSIVPSAFVAAGFLIGVLQSLRLGRDFGTPSRVDREKQPLRFWIRAFLHIGAYLIVTFAPML